jgi:hypothetical protein
MPAMNYSPSDATLVWVLRDDPSRHATSLLTDCYVSQELDGRWTMTVSRGLMTLVSETRESRSAAIVRAEELQQILLRFGWTDQPSA